MLIKGLRETEAFFISDLVRLKINARMKQSDAEKPIHSVGFFVSLSGGDAVRTVCAALILASLATWFRIVSIW